MYTLLGGKKDFFSTIFEAQHVIWNVNSLERLAATYAAYISSVAFEGFSYLNFSFRLKMI